MKKSQHFYFLILVSVLFNTSSLGQLVPFYNSLENIFDSKIDVKSINDTLWVRDSIYYYKKIGAQLEPYKKSVVQSRDGNEMVLESITYKIDTFGSWRNYKKKNIRYHENGIVKDSIVILWDNKDNTWTDTLKCIERDNKGMLVKKRDKTGFRCPSGMHKGISNEIYCKYNSDSKLVYRLNKMKIFGEWTKIVEEYITYNSDGNIVLLNENKYGYMDCDYYSPELYRQYLFKYDANNRLSEKKYLERKNNSAEWSKVSKKNYYYSSNDDILDFEKWFVWEDSSNQWVNQYYNKYIYEVGKLKSIIWNKWNEDSFKIFFRNLYSYNDDGLLVHKLEQWWHKETSEWRDEKEFIFDFNDSGKNTLYEYINRRKKIRKFVIDYDNQNRPILYKHLINDNLNNWSNYFQSDVSYTRDGKMISFLNKGWNRTLNEWYLPTKKVMLKNDYGLLIREITSRTEDGKWDDINKKEFYWSFIKVLKIQPFKKSKLKIYPNPANDYIKIANFEKNAANNIFIFSISGDLVLEGKLDSNNNFEISSLENGVYLLQYGDKENRNILKFIVDRSK